MMPETGREDKNGLRGNASCYTVILSTVILTREKSGINREGRDICQEDS